MPGCVSENFNFSHVCGHHLLEHSVCGELQETSSISSLKPLLNMGLGGATVDRLGERLLRLPSLLVARRVSSSGSE